MSRWKASAIHCGISFMVVLAIAALMALTWYPPLLAWAGGRAGIIPILFAVDVTLGPLLTLLVFKPGKPSLKFDLGVIALLQVLGLGYGLHILYEARPVYVVFAVDAFHLVNAVDIPLENLGRAEREEFKSLPLAGPEIVAARLPQDEKQKRSITMDAIMGGADVHQYPQHYLPYREAARDALNKAAPLQKLAGRDAATRGEIDAWLAKNRREAATVKWLPLLAKAHELTVLIDGASGEVLDILPIKPS